MIVDRSTLYFALMIAAIAACGEDSPGQDAQQALVYREANGIYPQAYPRIVLANGDGTGRRVLCDSCGDLRSGSPLYPSPSGSVILFETESESGYSWISVSSSGGDASLFPTGSSWRSPAWSPDGRTIAWGIGDTGIVRIGIAAVRSTTPTMITADSLSVTSFAWSPDGARLAFSAARAGDEDVYTVRRDGTGLTVVSATAGVADRLPAWSPGGDSIAFFRVGSATPEEDGMWISPSRGGAARLVSQGLFAGLPWLSPDGREVLALAYRGNRYQLVRITVASGQQIDIPALGSTFATTPWSPDGDLIVTFNWLAYNAPFSIFTSPSEGTPRVQINPDTMSASRAAWLPAGN